MVTVGAGGDFPDMVGRATGRDSGPWTRQACAVNLRGEWHLLAREAERRARPCAHPIPPVTGAMDDHQDCDIRVACVTAPQQAGGAFLT